MKEGFEMKMWERRRDLFAGFITPRPDIELVGFKSEKYRDVYSLLTDVSVPDDKAITFVARKEGKTEDKFLMLKRNNAERLSYIEIVRPHER